MKNEPFKRVSNQIEMKKRGKRASILVENVVFIVLNLVFLTILILFIARQGSGAILLEESYAKQIALIMDSAKPGMDIFIDFEKGIEKIKDSFGDEYYTNSSKFQSTIIVFNDNIVTVKLKEGKREGYSYSFFNDIQLNDFNYYVTDGKLFFRFTR